MRAVFRHPIYELKRGYIFEPGRDIVGRAFRRLQPGIYLREKTPDSDASDEFELIRSQTPESRPYGVLSVPLFYKGTQGRSVDVPAVSSRAAGYAFCALWEGGRPLFWA